MRGGLRAIELEAVADKWLCSVSERLNHLGEQLQKVEAELVSRDIKELSTPQLHSAAPLRRAGRDDFHVVPD